MTASIISGDGPIKPFNKSLHGGSDFTPPDAEFSTTSEGATAAEASDPPHRRHDGGGYGPNPQPPRPESLHDRVENTPPRVENLGVSKLTAKDSDSCTGCEYCADDCRDDDCEGCGICEGVEPIDVDRPRFTLKDVQKAVAQAMAASQRRGPIISEGSTVLAEATAEQVTAEVSEGATAPAPGKFARR